MAEDTTRTEWRAPSGHVGISLSRLPGWVIPVVTIVIAIAAAWVMDTMQEYAIQDRKAQTVLSEFEADLDEQEFAEERALREGEFSPESAEDLTVERLELQGHLNQLQALKLEEEETARVRTALSKTEAAVDEEVG